MPRRAKGPRLWLLKRKGREAVWVILDAGKQYSTGCSESDRSGAEQSLGRHIASKYNPPTRETELDRILIADVMTIYLREHAPKVVNPEFIKYTAGPIIDWWGAKTLATIRGQSCRDYVEWRCAQGVRDQTARHDLKTLRAAIKHYHREHGPLSAVPALTFPDISAPKDRWLRRAETAALLWFARRHPRLARFIIIGYYTGTRKDAIARMKWVPSLTTGWFDLEAGLMHRMGAREKATKKRRTPCRIPAGLLPHLKRWRAADMANGWTDVCHHHGKASKSIKTSWRTALLSAGLAKYIDHPTKPDKKKLVTDVTPHTLRHTCCTWLMHRGVPIAEAAGFVGMSIEMFDRTYGHHHPDYMAKASARRQ